MAAEEGNANCALFTQGIEDFVNEFVSRADYRKKLPKDSKIIHDPLWGTIRLDPWEVALLDLPLFQRLRQIHQTSLVSYVFPGCSHTRFEHTLGVLQQAQKIMDSVNNQYASASPCFEPTVIKNIRLAALFHDVGHSCFSHISEDLYGSCSDMTDALSGDENFRNCHPHEVLSAKILLSPAVKDFISLLEDHYKNTNLSLNPQDAAQWIIGRPRDNELKRYYETQVINGPFDADKLDYIFRDAHYSGIPVGLDLERLWASCKVEKDEDGKKILTLHQASVAPLEQILFSKISLFAIVYQHPKVRAAEKMFQGLIDDIKADSTNPFTVADRKLDLKHATDFLWLTDEVFFSQALFRPKTDNIHKRIHDIRYRRLFVRALTISSDTVHESPNPGFTQLRKLNQRGAETYNAKRDIARSIIEQAGLQKKVLLSDVWVDLPTDPKFGEADRTFVRTHAGALRKVSDLFPIQYWSEMYQKYKWRGHVFCPQEYQQEIHEAALEVFRSNFELKFKKSAGETAHVPNPKASI